MTSLVFRVVSSSYRASDERAAPYRNDRCKVESYISALLAWILSCMQIFLLYREIFFPLFWEIGLQRILAFVKCQQTAWNPDCLHSKTFRSKGWQIALLSVTRSFRTQPEFRVVLCVFTFQCALLCYYQIPVFVRLVMSSPNGITLHRFVFLPLLVQLHYNFHLTSVDSGEQLWIHEPNQDRKFLRYTF